MRLIITLTAWQHLKTVFHQTRGPQKRHGPGEGSVDMKAELDASIRLPLRSQQQDFGSGAWMVCRA